MAPLARGLVRSALLACFILGLLTLILVPDDLYCTSPLKSRKQKVGSGHGAQHRLDLDEQQCRAAYPLFLTEVDALIARGKFELEKTEADYQGLVQGRILNNNLHILTTAPDTVPQILHQRTSVLSQLHRALLTSPSPLPNTHFALTTNDVAKNNSWAFSRPNKPTPLNTWPMPSFAGWSWPQPHLGPLPAILERIAAVEASTPWARKHGKAVWRGTPWFNPIGHPNLRKDLLRVAKGKAWADVAALTDESALRIEDFCRYKYVVYTEGVAYSGRLPYHQACESVLLMAPLGWVTTTALLVRPIWGAELLGGTGGAGRGKKERVEGGLPTVGSYEDANVVYVEADFSDLGAVVGFLEEHPEVARRIARNQRELAVGKGYLGLSAETCYWRALIRGWSDAAVVKRDEWGDEVGERYETWLLHQVSKARERGSPHISP